jgi:uncharacterized protein
MSCARDAVTITEDVVAHRFETTVAGHIAQLVYRRDGDRLVLAHTEVPDELGGRGIGGLLVGTAVEAAIAGDLTVVPECPFARSWLLKHAEIARRVRVEWPRQRP